MLTTDRTTTGGREHETEKKKGRAEAVQGVLALPHAALRVCGVLRQSPSRRSLLNGEKIMTEQACTFVSALQCARDLRCAIVWMVSALQADEPNEVIERRLRDIERALAKLRYALEKKVSEG